MVFGLALGLLLSEGLLRIVSLITISGARGSRFSASLAREDTRLGFVLIPGATARHVSREFDVEVTINGRGFRQRSPPPLARTEGVPRVAVLGDSFAFGWGVREEERFTENLAVSLRAEVMNLGVPGTGTDQQLLIYEERGGRELRGDLVLLEYFVDAVTRNASGMDSGRRKPRFVFEGSELRYVPPPQSGSSTDASFEATDRGLPLPFKQALAQHSEVYRLLRGAFGQSLRELLRSHERDPYPQYVADDEAWRVTKALIARLEGDVSRDGGRLALVIVPEVWHQDPDAAASRTRAISEFCAASRIPCLDLAPALSTRDYYPFDGHWTAQGHAHAAAAIAAFIEHERLLEPRRAR